MAKPKFQNALYWLLPICFYAGDANAWGLYTHVYFAQSLLVATPLLDKRLRKAIKDFPELVMVGACLPDLAVISKKFNTSHQWEKAEQLITLANTPEETAIAIGYANHLYVDVIAHNHFVPAHEALWRHGSMATHISAEWALDAHLSSAINATPSRLLTEHMYLISHFIAPCFDYPAHFVKKKLRVLAYSDRLLRLVRLPNLIHQCIKFNNQEKYKHFNYYINKTKHALNDFHKILDGDHPNWKPELHVKGAIETKVWREKCLLELNNTDTQPISYYKSTSGLLMEKS